ncbi:MAG: glutathione S-transferase family protein [Gammaproteobacteria bacterium]|nr:glutathione S-transferase family protein [Gammaproteobacteria bacterium]
MSLILYGASLSPFVRKVRTCLLEKKLEYTMELIIPRNQPDWYYQINPLGRIPALRDGQFDVCDSAVICAYLEDKYPNTLALCGNTAEEAARIRWFEKYGDYEVGPLATFTVFFNRVLAKSMGLPCDEAAVQKALQKLVAHYDYLESQLADSDYFVGQRFTLADIAIATHWVNFSYAQEQLDAQRWPKLAAHQARILARDSLQLLLADEAKMLARLR